ncbi:phage tail protein [Brevibacillus borstelensis]|uniref:phage tail protein n=1 Tax=Brevibacillus borstelensis TaxID=45462 RepID=UPI0030BD3E2D
MEGENKFFSMNKAADWGRGAWVNLQCTDEGLELECCEDYEVHHVRKAADLFRLEGASAAQADADSARSPRLLDFAIGRPGTIYWLDESGALTSYDDANQYKETLFRAGHQLFTPYAAVLADEKYLFIVDPGAARKVAAYSVGNGQCVWSEEQWEGMPLFPVAAGVDGGGMLYVVLPLVSETFSPGERLPEGTEIAVLKFDRAGKVVSRFSHSELRLQRAGGIREVQRGRLFQLCVPDSGELYVFQKESGQVVCFTPQGATVATLAIPAGARPGGFGVGAGPILFLGDLRRMDSAHDHSRFILRFLPSGEAVHPLTCYRGRADQLLCDKKQRLYVWDADSEMLSILQLSSRTSRLEPPGLPVGYYFSHSLDSTQTETRWHKFTIDSERPEETQTLVSYFASDRKQQVLNGKLRDLDEFLADPAVEWQEKLRATASLWSEPVVNASDALFLSAQGRYLWLKIELHGTEQHSPLLRQLRVYTPRHSPLRYLPAVFREEPESADFLERFLALFGTFFLEIEQKIDSMSRYFDPDTTPDEFVPWLASWLGIASEDHWSEAQLRELIRRAPELFSQRGTRSGLANMVQLYTGERPIIVEHFQIRDMLANPELHPLVSELYVDNPYSFCLLVTRECVSTEKDRLAVQKILDDQKPAFTEAKLVVIQPGIYADLHSYAGINTYLSEPSWLTLDQNLSIPYNTVLGTRDRSRRIDADTRLGFDSSLE